LDGDEFFWAPSLRHSRGEWQQLLETLGHCYVRGAQIDWRSFDQPYPRRSIPLPTYPFQRHRYWLDRGSRWSEQIPIPARVAAITDETKNSTNVYSAPSLTPDGKRLSEA